MPSKGLFTGSDGSVDGDLKCIAAEWGDSTAELVRRFIFNPKELPTDKQSQGHWSICTGYTDGHVPSRTARFAANLDYNPRFIGSWK